MCSLQVASVPGAGRPQVSTEDALRSNSGKWRFVRTRHAEPTWFVNETGCRRTKRLLSAVTA